jgi:hypothetical protein
MEALMEDDFRALSDGHTFKLRQRIFLLENAKTHAIVIAEDPAKEDEWEGYWVVVTDAQGIEIARVPARCQS